MQKKKKTVIFFIGLFLFLFANTNAAPVAVTVNANVKYQEFEGWGTSICWWGNIIGKYSQQSRDSILDLLFDTSNGLGMSIIRYNIGGGENPSHNHMGTGKMMEGFKASENAPYDWTKDAGQRLIVEGAKKRIPKEWFIAEAFSNSPPYWMTNSGCASGNAGGGNNLKSGYYDDFADYLTEVVKHFRDAWGITFRTLEPMNEPMVGWSVNGGQEGCHIDVSLQDDLIREVKAKLDAKGLTETKISASDETNIDQALSTWNAMDANTKSLIYQVNTHVYYGSKRAELRTAVGNRKLWDSECDGSGASDPFAQFAHNHDDFVPGLDIANRAIKDLREMKVNGWVFWQAVESEQAQTSLNKNWGLIHADFNGGRRYFITKKYYAVKQFSNFIRPASTMIDINNNDAVAFISPKQEKLIIVQRNASTSAVSYDYKLTNFQKVGSTAAVWRSSATEDLKKLDDLNIVNNTLSATSPARSITTYVIQLNPVNVIPKAAERASSLLKTRCVNSVLTVEFTMPVNQASVKVFNLNGSLLKTESLKAATGDRNSIISDLSSYPEGNYIVGIFSGNQLVGTSKITLAK
ncbi:MAG: alpha-L-arabinofuranosidase [Fibrobacter sp.]|nr:alpha-L-arabinofuranosidase [Fibrobacter sp.]